MQLARYSNHDEAERRKDSGAVKIVNYFFGLTDTTVKNGV